jgi:hypothetical protein
MNGGNVVTAGYKLVPEPELPKTAFIEVPGGAEEQGQNGRSWCNYQEAAAALVLLEVYLLRGTAPLVSTLGCRFFYLGLSAAQTSARPHNSLETTLQLSCDTLQLSPCDHSAAGLLPPCSCLAAVAL